MMSPAAHPRNYSLGANSTFFGGCPGSFTVTNLTFATDTTVSFQEGYDPVALDLINSLYGDLQPQNNFLPISAILNQSYSIVSSSQPAEVSSVSKQPSEHLPHILQWTLHPYTPIPTVRALAHNLSNVCGLEGGLFSKV